ncbi:MAG: cell division protein FtsZ [Nevskiaceae bacterium]|nr:MAG: cell division protein FtsZ [Nevskiaceae bacterium]TBR73390.1 MAG: cell division protein FtsZ [Nevskiaceae bacterium]
MSKETMNETFELVDGQSKRAVIRVIGVGGGGCNTVNQMAQADIQGVEFICANTDRDHLEKCLPVMQLQIGAAVTRGLGAGSDPKVGREAAEEDQDRIREMLEDTDLLFVTAGMGGGTGTGAAPVIAQIAQELGILTVAVVTKPFPHEGKKRMRIALDGIKELQQRVDSLIVIPNEKLRLVLGGSVTLLSGFKAANDVLQNAVQGISDLITRPGMMNVDFADVRTVMSNRGMAMMGLGAAQGEDRAERAVEAALASPLLDDLELAGARGILVNITCDDSLTLDELERVNTRINEIASAEADTKFGTSFDPSLNGELRVTVVATGLDGQRGVQVAAQPEVAVPAATMGGLHPLVTHLRPSSLTDARPAVETPMPRRMPMMRGNSALAIDEEILDIPAFLREQAD